MTLYSTYSAKLTDVDL